MPVPTPRDAGRPSGREALLLAVAVGWTVGFSAWFFQLELPNNPQVSRSAFWSLVPELLADLALPSEADDGASRWAHVAQRLDVFAVAGVIVAAALGLGHIVLAALRPPLEGYSAERTVFAFGCGVSLLTQATLGCGLAGWLSRTVLGGIVVVGLVGGVAVRARSLLGTWSESGRERGPGRIGNPSCRGLLKAACLLVIAPFVVAMLLGATLPPTDFDAKAYHLVGPKEWFQSGRITFLPHNVYTSFPFLTEMLSLLGMVLRDDWYRGALAGQAVLMSFIPFTALAVYAAARRWFSPAAGWLAALVSLTTPWSYRIATIAYAEGGLSFFLIAAVLAVGLAVERRRAGKRSRQMFLLGGLLAGSAMACKYTGVVQVVIPLGLAAVAAGWRWPRAVHADESPVRPIHGSQSRATFVHVGLLFTAGVLLTVGPWLLKNVMQTGNPVYPLLSSVFGGRDWDAELAARFRAGHSSRADQYTAAHLGANLTDVAARNDWHSPLLFGLAPLAFFWRRKRARPADAAPEPRVPDGDAGGLEREPAVPIAAGWLWAYVAWLFLTWWVLTHRIDRFWVPMIPVVAVLAGAGATWSRHFAWKLVCGVVIAASVAFNLAFVSTALAGNDAWLGDLGRLRQAAEQQTAPTIAMLNEMYEAGRLPQGSQVLLVGDAQVFDARFPHAYNTVFNRSRFEEFFGERDAGSGTWRLADEDDIRARLSAAAITHVAVNWQELLRYRTTYGYSEFVAPARFAALVQRGILREPVTLSLSGRPIEELPDDVRRQLDRWAPELVVTMPDGPRYVAAQLYAVRPGSRR